MVTPSLAAGGAERSVVLLSEGFLCRRHEITVVSLSGSTVDSFKLPAGVRRLALDIAADSYSSISALGNNLRRLKVLRKAIRTTRPDVVLSHMTQTNVLTTLALGGTKYRAVLIEHSDPARNTPHRVWRTLRRAVYPRAAAVVSVSRGIDKYFSWLPAAKRAVIPNPIAALKVTQPATTDPQPAPNTKFIVAMGRLIPVKGFDRLLSAFAQLTLKHPEWNLMILGEGGLRSQLEQQITELGLAGRVQLKGFVSNPVTVLNQCEFFVMTSRSEGFPYALLEAMSCGLPAVAIDCESGPREIIREGIDGMLVPEGDVNALAAAMDHLISDPTTRQRLGERATDVLDRFGTERVIAQWEALFARL